MARVLVVEDNPVNMKLAALLLHKGGHAVLCAVTAEAGLVLARSERPDLILMDIQLPGMDGLAATALLKQDPATAGIPVIALTAMETKSDQDNGRAAGCAAYIAKPLRYQELYAVIDTLLGTGKSFGSPDAGPPSSADIAHTASISAAVDVNALQGLIGGDPDVTLEFLNEFRASAARIATELRTACVDGMAAQAGRMAHKLRSSAYIVGATVLSRLCAEMEAAGKGARTEDLKTLLPVFEQELTAVNACLATWVCRHQNGGVCCPSKRDERWNFPGIRP